MRESLSAHGRIRCVCMYACVYVRLRVRALERACPRACEWPRMHACARACVHVSQTPPTTLCTSCDRPPDGAQSLLVACCRD
eukprot:2467613-Pleurochrysis_carterae.AAC.2